MVGYPFAKGMTHRCSERPMNPPIKTMPNHATTSTISTAITIIKPIPWHTTQHELLGKTFHGRARSSGGEIMECNEEEFWRVGSQVFLEVSFFNFSNSLFAYVLALSLSKSSTTQLIMASNLVGYLRLLHQLRTCSHS